MSQVYALDAPKQCSARSGAMLLDSWSIAFGLWELCFPTRRAMLLSSGSIAFGFREQCFWLVGAMSLSSGYISCWKVQQIKLKNANDNNFFHFMISILWKNHYLCKQMCK